MDKGNYTDKYNYVILAGTWDLYKRAYEELLIAENVKYIEENKLDNNILFLIKKIHFNQKLNKIINLPGKSFWNKLIIKFKFIKSKPICFIIFLNWVTNESDIIKYIKKKYPNSKIVIIINDLIRTIRYRYTNEPLYIENLKKDSDIIISFDFKDAEKYNLLYYPIPYSKPKFFKQDRLIYDIYLLAKVKDRFDKILTVYKYLKKYNLNIKFILMGVPIEKRINLDGIEYSDKFMTYDENLNYIQKSKCLLEIMQGEGTGYTIRTGEAIVYDKFIITNNPYILKAPFYNPDYIIYFERTEDINPNFLHELKKNKIINYTEESKMFFSPKKLLEFIENKLNP
ncbi:MAG: hypothetical protein J1F12_00905 [Muribaculaceae bacterium]|nr:hypothetical protein [Muribaculaceae bacterium]